MILDAGFLIAVDRGDRSAHAFIAAAVRTGHQLHTTHPAAAQVWRDGARQARLARFLRSTTVHKFDDGRVVGQLVSAADTSDVVDAHLVITAVRLGVDIVTGDVDDLGRLAEVLGAAGPTIHAWP